LRKILFVVGVIAAFAIPAAALGVNINPGQVGTGCPGDADYHFVAPGGGADSRLTVDFSGSGDVTSIAPTFYNNGTAHWWVAASGTINSASATNANRLVLSEAICDQKKDPKK
jgi:hypothetical protein